MSRARTVTNLFILLSLAAIAIPGDREPRAEEPPAAASAKSSEETSAEKAIGLALEKPVEIEWTELPLGQVMQSLSKKYGIPIHIDERALKDVGIDTNTLVTKHLKGVTLRSALRLVLKEMDLGWMIRDEVLLITTPEEISAQLITRVYPVEDLVGPQDSPGLIDRVDRLIDVITHTIQPTTWDSAGGYASISGLGHSLVVSESLDSHDEIVALLAMLRQSKQSYAKWDGKTRPIPALPPTIGFQPGGPFIEQWEPKRRQKIAIEVVEMPLIQVAERFQLLAGLEFQIDDKALKDVGIDSKTEITFHCRDLPLESALRLMLRDMDLTFVPRDEVILITTPEEANARLETWVFPVFDLVRDSPADLFEGDAVQSPAELIGVMTSSLTPGDWDSVGGPGSMQYHAESGSLVVSQTRERMYGIAEFLTRLRQTQPIAAKVDPAQLDATIVTRIHGPFATNKGAAKSKPAELAVAICELIEPETWNKPDSSVRMAILADRLVIRHQAQVHARIDRLLQSMIRELKGDFCPFCGGKLSQARQKRAAFVAPPCQFGDRHAGPVQAAPAVDPDPFGPKPAAPAPADPFAPAHAAPRPAEADPFGPAPAAPPAPAPAPAPAPGPAVDPFGLTAKKPGVRAARRVPLELALEKRVDLEVTSRPLSEVVELLAAKTGAEIEIDQHSLASIGLDHRSEVTLHLQDIRLKSALAHLCAESATTWLVSEGVILISTTEDADRKLRTRLYPVGDLLAIVDGQPDFEELSRVITSTIEPARWDFVGGPGGIDNWGDMLVVSQTPGVHEEVARLLAALRRAKGSFAKWRGGGHIIPDLPAVGAWHGEEEVAGWEAARSKQVSLKFQGANLGAVVKELSATTGVLFVLHQGSIRRELEVRQPSAITYACQDKPLEEALREMLEPLQLSIQPWHEAIRIAAKAEIEVEDRKFWVYPIFDLDDGEKADSESLIEGLQEVTDTDSWDTQGGPGTVKSYEPAHAIVVAHDSERRRKIAIYFEALRKSAGDVVKRSPEPAAAEWVTRGYREPPFVFPTGTALGLPAPIPPPGSKLFLPKELAEVIRTFIEPQSWNRPGSQASIDAREENVVVCQRPAVHARIDRFVEELKRSYQGYSPAPEELAASQPEKPLLQEQLRTEASRREVDYEAVEMPLQKILAELARQSRLPITFDTVEFRAQGLDPNYPVSIRLKKMSLVSALDLLTHELNLAWGVREQGLMITSSEGAGKLQFAKEYRVDDLVGPPGAHDPSGQLERLLSLASGAIPDAREGLDHASRIQIRADQPPLILETAHGHAHIVRFLQLVRNCRSRMLQWDGVVRPPAGQPSDGIWRMPQPITAAWQRLRRKPVAWNLDKMPLDKLAEGLSERLGVSFLIDKVELRDCGIDNQLPVTFRCQDTPLEEALRRITRQHQLRLVAQGPAVQITTEDAASSRLTACLHSVYDLGWDDGESLCRRENGGGYLPDLVDLVESSIAPSEWTSVGGKGTIEFLPRAGALIVLQTDEIQEEIAEFLGDLRKTVPPLAQPIATTTADAWGARVHLLPAKREPALSDAQILAKIRAEIAPETWGEAGGLLLIAGDRLVVRQSMRVQDRIGRYLQSLEPRKASH